MACYSPAKAYKGKPRPDGKVNIVWRRAEAWKGEELYLPCSKCIGCREQQARGWALRCMHEISLHDENSFITLTYDNGNMPYNGGLRLDHWQKFMKRLRKANAGKKIRFFHSGEYGDQLKRPHYHAILFGKDFNDKVKLKEAKGNKYYTSKELSELWPYGYHLIGEATFGSACYIARYVHKKAGKSKDEAIERGVRPEYSTMSRRPGIGKGWYDKYKAEVYPSDEIISKGVSSKPPRFYDNLLDKENPLLLKQIKKQREKDGRRIKLVTYSDGKKVLVNENDSFRLPVREEVHRAKLDLNKKRHWR